MTNKYLTFTNETDCITALAKVNNNRGCPIHKPNGYVMEKWNNKKKAHNQDLWYFAKPKDEFMEGVVNYTEADYNSDWEEPLGN